MAVRCKGLRAADACSGQARSLTLDRPRNLGGASAKCLPWWQSRVPRGTIAGHIESGTTKAESNTPSDIRFCPWGGLDSNQRPTDYESENARTADLQRFLEVLVRSNT
jgi:hypothetical protein